MKRLAVSISLALLLVLSLVSSVLAADGIEEQQIRTSIKRAVNYLHDVQNTDGGFPWKEGGGSDQNTTTWVIMALKAAGEDVNSDKWAPSGKTPVDYLEECEVSLESTTDYARTLLALSAAKQGGQYQGINLVDMILSYQQEDGQFAQVFIGEQGFINAHMWSILALSAAGQEIPDKEKAKTWLVKRRNDDGGFGWIEGIDSDADDTAVAIRTLVLLGEDPESSVVIRNALKYLKSCQKEDGGFNSGWAVSDSNTCSDSWVMQALVAAGENPQAEEWSVNGKNVVSHILSLQDEPGAFYWVKDAEHTSISATVNAIMALALIPYPQDNLLSPGLAADESINCAVTTV